MLSDIHRFIAIPLSAALICLPGCIIKESDQVEYIYTIEVNANSRQKVEEIHVTVKSGGITLLNRTFQSKDILSGQVAVSFTAGESQEIDLSYTAYKGGTVVGKETYSFNASTIQKDRKRTFMVGSPKALCCDDPMYDEYEEGCLEPDKNACKVVSAKMKSSGTFIDRRDGKSYKWVNIGNQIWMAENLNYKPPNGKSWCYNYNTSNCETYGSFYDWATVMDIDTIYNHTVWDGSSIGRQGLCPDGWHLPSKFEWTDLENALGGQYKAGEKLKAKSFKGTDEYGFFALPVGKSSYGEFREFGKFAYFWTSSAFDDDRAWQRYLSGGDVLYSNHPNKKTGISVRCIRN